MCVGGGDPCQLSGRSRCPSHSTQSTVTTRELVATAVVSSRCRRFIKVSDVVHFGHFVAVVKSIAIHVQVVQIQGPHPEKM